MSCHSAIKMKPPCFEDLNKHIVSFQISQAKKKKSSFLFQAALLCYQQPNTLIDLPLLCYYSDIHTVAKEIASINGVDLLNIRNVLLEKWLCKTGQTTNKVRDGRKVSKSSSKNLIK